MKNKYSIKRRLLRESEEEDAFDASYEEALQRVGDPEVTSSEAANPVGGEAPPSEMVDDADNVFDVIDDIDGDENEV